MPRYPYRPDSEGWPDDDPTPPDERDLAGDEDDEEVEWDEAPIEEDPEGYGPEPFDMDRPEGDDGGASWILNVGRVLGLLAVIGLVAPLIFGVVRAMNSDGDTATRAESRAQPPRARAQVTEVIDGRTIRVDLDDGTSAVVRYIGVEVPPPSDPYFDLAAAVNRRWVSGQEVLLEADAVERDREGRLLRYVWFELDEGGRMVNADLIGSGLARWVSGGGNDRYAAAFVEIEGNAKASERGIWDKTAGGA